MDEFWKLVIGVIGSFIFVGLGVLALQRVGRNSARITKEYIKKTDVCPTCYGRGRVLKKGYAFVKDPFKTDYEAEYRLQGVPEPFRKAFKEDR